MVCTLNVESPNKDTRIRRADHFHNLLYNSCVSCQRYTYRRVLAADDDSRQEVLLNAFTTQTNGCHTTLVTGLEGERGLASVIGNGYCILGGDGARGIRSGDLA